MISPSLKPTTSISENRFAVFSLPAASQPPLNEEGIEALLKKLIAGKWQRVSSEYDDPLGMLFTNRVKQWTAGWGPSSNGLVTSMSLYVVVWDVDSWNNTPTWNFYENGRLIYEGKDIRQNPLSNLLKQMLEGENLPFITHADLLSPIRHSAAANQAMLFHHLANSILTRPEMLSHLQAPLLDWMEEKISMSEAAQDMAARLQQETFILQQLEGKNQLVFLFRRFYERNLMSALADKKRLFQALQFMQDDYFCLGYQINPVFRTAYERSYDAFRRQITEGTWQVRLKQEAASAS